MTATVAILGKAIYYGPMGVWMLLIPKAASVWASAPNTTGYLYPALATTALLTASFVAAYSLFPETVVSMTGSSGADRQEALST